MGPTPDQGRVHASMDRTTANGGSYCRLHPVDRLNLIGRSVRLHFNFILFDLTPTRFGRSQAPPWSLLSENDSSTELVDFTSQSRFVFAAGILFLDSAAPLSG